MAPFPTFILLHCPIFILFCFEHFNISSVMVTFNALGFSHTALSVGSFTVCRPISNFFRLNRKNRENIMYLQAFDS